MVGTRKSLPSLAMPDDIPAELRIDGKSTLLGEKRDEAPKRVYYWKGAVYEATANTPKEWLTQEPERKKRKRSPSPLPTPLPPQKKRKPPPTTTTITSKKRKSTTTTATRAEETVVFDLTMASAADVKAEVKRKKEEARKNGYRVHRLRADELRDILTINQAGREPGEEDTETGRQLGQKIYAMAKVNSRIDTVKARYQKMKDNGLSVDVLKKRKRATGKSEDENTMPGSSSKRARHDLTEGDTTHIDGLLQITTPEETGHEYGGIAQLQAAAHAASPDHHERETRSQLDSQLRSPSPIIDSTVRPATNRSTPAEEGYTSSSEVPPRRHASSVSMSISSGTSPSIHEAATAPAVTNNTNTTARSSRPNDHFGKQQPRTLPPELAQKNRGGQTLRWSIKSEDITKNPERAESLIHKGRMNGESKQARRRRVARELAFLRNMPTQEV